MENFVFGLLAKEDFSFGHGSFSATLPDGSTATLTKVNLSALYPAYAVTFSATPTFDLANGATQTITLTGNVTSSTINAGGGTPATGSRIVLRIVQDGTGGRTFAWPASVSGAVANMVTGIASAITIVELQFNGTTWNFVASPLVLVSSNIGVTRVRSLGGTALVAGDFALSAGFGTTASVGTISGTDQRARFTVTSAGTGQGANPTITLTFKDGTWTVAPFVVVVRNGGLQATVLPTWTVSATQLVITFAGTPVDTQTYTYEFIALG